MPGMRFSVLKITFKPVYLAEFGINIIQFILLHWSDLFMLPEATLMFLTRVKGLATLDNNNANHR